MKIFKYKNVVLLFIAEFILLLVFLPLMSKILTKTIVPEHVDALKSALIQEKSYLVDQAQNLAKQGSLEQAIVDNDETRLVSITTTQQESAGVDNVIVINNEGKIVNQSAVPINADYYYNGLIDQNTPWVKNILSSRIISSFEEISPSPLSLVGGTSIHDKDTGAIIGGVLLGFNLNDKYAARLQKTYLSSDNRIVFYNKNGVVLGNGFNDQNFKNRIITYLNQQIPDLLSINGPEDDHHQNFKFTGKIYHAHNFKLKNADGSIIGGLLVLMPLRQLAVSIMVSAVFTLLFFCILMLGSKKTFPDMTKLIHLSDGIAEVVMSLVVFIAILLVTNVMLGQMLVGAM